MEIKIDWSIKAVLATIALGLLINGLNPWIKPGDAYAAGGDAGWVLPMHFEISSGQVYDRRNGQIFGWRDDGKLRERERLFFDN